ncbi:MAG: hypothetical protein WDO71_17435 [Bacteroidota bacterium]
MEHQSGAAGQIIPAIISKFIINQSLSQAPPEFIEGRGFGLRNIPFRFLVKEFRLYQVGQVHYGLVVLNLCIVGFYRVDRDAVVNTIMKGKEMAFEFELPVNGVEIICFTGKMDAEISARMFATW